MSIERIVGRALKVGRDDTSKQKAKYIVVLRCTCVPNESGIKKETLSEELAYSSNVNKINVLSSLKLEYSRSGTSQ